MGERSTKEQNRHDAVVEASAAKWGDLGDRGLIISTNPGDEENQLAGPAWSPRYPDVVIWKPEEPGADHGTPMILEEVETASTIDEEEVAQWRDYAELYAHRFHLVVPKKCAEDVMRLVQKYDVMVTEIITYALEGDRLHFESFAKPGPEEE